MTDHLRTEPRIADHRATAPVIDAEPWVRKPAVAKHLNCTVRHVEKLTAAGMPSIKIGGMRRYRLSAVDAWLDQLDGQTLAA